MISSFSQSIETHLQKIKLPEPDSYKGQNGKLLLIGGSELFHAASKWSLDVASKIVDMVFYSSTEENNQLIQKVKGEFWNGIVVKRDNIEDYIQEADCILIGPGMERNSETEKITNTLVAKFSEKKWVIDAGALQMIDPQLLNENHIITPHDKEMQKLRQKMNEAGLEENIFQPVVLLKGVVDEVFGGRRAKLRSIKVSDDGGREQAESIKISGGNGGMTKGGTGDVLAGLVSALYCTHDAVTAAVVGSYVNKKAGDKLFEQVGPYFNASDLVETVPGVLYSSTKLSLQKLQK